MAAAFAVLLVVHGLIHLLGFAKAFGLAELPQLSQPIPTSVGLLWLFTAVLFVATAISLFAWPRIWWAVGAAAVTMSVGLIVLSWTDAKFGLVANAIVLVGVVLGFFAQVTNPGR